MATLQELADQGVRDIRLEKWSDPRDHITFEVTEQFGIMPWAVMNFASLGPADPKMILVVECEAHDPDWVAWDAPA